MPKFETIFYARELLRGSVILLQREHLPSKHGVPNLMKLPTSLRPMTTFISVPHSWLNKP
jgi:hypothetical protein